MFPLALDTCLGGQALPLGPTLSSTSDLIRAASEPGLRGAAGQRRDAILGSVFGLGPSGLGQTPAPLTSPLEKQNKAVREAA